MKILTAYALSVAAIALLTLPAIAGPGPDKATPAPQNITAKDIEAVTFSVQHQTLSPTAGTAGNQWTLGGAAFFPFSPSWGLNLDGGLSTTANSGTAGTPTRLQISLVTPWARQAGGILSPAGRAGFNIGFQNNPTPFTGSASTWNYGGFVEIFPSNNFTLSAKAGIVSGCAASNGYYVGGGVSLYATPDFSLKGTYDYSRWNAGSNESDYGLRAEHLLSRTSRFSLYGGYAKSDFSPATNFHVNSTTFGLNYYGGGNKGAALVDTQRKGTLPNSNLYLSVQCRF